MFSVRASIHAFSVAENGGHEMTMMCFKCERPSGKRGAECRPYGPGGKLVCWDCMKADMALEHQCQRSFGILLEAAEAAGAGMVILTTAGPQPAPDDMAEDLQH